MNAPLVSVIIPVYNTEKYLVCCLDSVIKQTYKNIEIILINDGSDDNSGDICEEYARLDERIKVLHQDNEGQASARNKALAISNGAYISFVDSDDYISENQLECLMKNALEYDADIAQCMMVKFSNSKYPMKTETKRKKGQEEVQIYSASKALEEFCYQRKFYASPCCKVIRKELMEGMKFPTNMGYEDFAIMYQVIGKAKKIVWLSDVLYFYRQHNSSTMHTAFSEKKVDRIVIAEQLKKYITTTYPENIKAMHSRYLLANLQLLMDLPYDNYYADIRKNVYKNILEVREDVIKDKKSKKSLRVMAFISYTGVYALMILGRLYKTMQR